MSGDQVGHDLIKNYITSPTDPTPMRLLIEKLKHEREGDATFTETLAVLKRYTTPPPGEDVDGLEKKLRAADRTALLEFAARAKEVFAKTLLENQFSETGQEILAYLLAEVYTRFQMHVSPAIRDGKSQDKVNERVQIHVVDEVRRLLGENPLRLFAEEINGMLYFLTGNCHIRWVS